VEREQDRPGVDEVAVFVGERVGTIVE